MGKKNRPSRKKEFERIHKNTLAHYKYRKLSVKIENITAKVYAFIILYRDVYPPFSQEQLNLLEYNKPNLYKRYIKIKNARYYNENKKKED